MRFTKMQGCGNDYIYVNTLSSPLQDPIKAARKWSAYHTGIGADGLVLIGASEKADFSMRIFNADGSEAMMCGNASRCIGKYVYEKGLTDKEVITLETLSGIKILKLHTGNGVVKDVTVDMGTPLLSNPGQIAMKTGGMLAETILVDGKEYKVAHKEGMYIGMGSKDISFASENADSPAKFYLNSAPAHMTYPTVLIKPEGTPEDGVVIVKDCNKVELGSLETANHRTICKYILPGQVESCQLEMGMTKLEPGSVWNTMPCHTHDRRMEVYLYFDMPKDALVMHYMGEPTETRHIVMRNEQAVISPSWSIHSGCGTQAYTFIWGMVGENQDFDDMDDVAMKDLM